MLTSHCCSLRPHITQSHIPSPIAIVLYNNCLSCLSPIRRSCRCPAALSGTRYRSPNSPDSSFGTVRTLRTVRILERIAPLGEMTANWRYECPEMIISLFSAICRFRKACWSFSYPDSSFRDLVVNAPRKYLKR